MRSVLLGDLLVIGGAAAWGATTLVMKASRLVTVAPEKTLIYQLGVSVPIFVVTSALFGERITHTPRLDRTGMAAVSGAGRRADVSGLVYADPALFGDPGFGLHRVDAAVRRGRGMSAAK